MSDQSICIRCGNQSQRYFSVCHACKEKEFLADYLKLPVAPWPSFGPYYSGKMMTFFRTLHEPLSLAHKDETYNDLRIVCCEKYAPEPLYTDLLFEENHYEQDNVNSEIFREAVEVFNATIRGMIVGYRPINLRPDIDAYIGKKVVA